MRAADAPRTCIRLYPETPEHSQLRQHWTEGWRLRQLTALPSLRAPMCTEEADGTHAALRSAAICSASELNSRGSVLLILAQVLSPLKSIAVSLSNRIPRGVRNENRFTNAEASPVQRGPGRGNSHCTCYAFVGRFPKSLVQSSVQSPGWTSFLTTFPCPRRAAARRSHKRSWRSHSRTPHLALEAAPAPSRT